MLPPRLPGIAPLAISPACCRQVLALGAELLSPSSMSRAAELRAPRAPPRAHFGKRLRRFAPPSGRAREQARPERVDQTFPSVQPTRSRAARVPTRKRICAEQFGRDRFGAGGCLRAGTFDASPVLGGKPGDRPILASPLVRRRASRSRTLVLVRRTRNRVFNDREGPSGGQGLASRACRRNPFGSPAPRPPLQSLAIPTGASREAIPPPRRRSSGAPRTRGRTL